MNVGINASFINLRSGVGTASFNLIKNLQIIAPDDVKFHFYLSERSVVPAFFDTENHIVSSYAIPEYNSFKKVMWEQFSLPSEIKKGNLNVFHGPAFMLPFNLKTPSIVTFHDLGYIRFPETIPLHKRVFYNFIMKRSLEISELVIVPSQFTKSELVNYFELPESKIQVIPWGLDNDFEPIEDKVKAKNFLKSHGVEKPFFLFVGVLEPRKNIENIINAFSLLNEKGIELVIAGKKGWMYKQIFDAIQKDDLDKNVKFIGEVAPSDLKLLYSSCLSLVFVTLYEGFGFPVIEAMACGAPVITSNTSSLPEVAGDSALFADPASPESIVEKMSMLLYDERLRKDFSEKGKVHSQKFSWEKCARETLKVYKKFA